MPSSIRRLYHVYLLILLAKHMQAYRSKQMLLEANYARNFLLLCISVPFTLVSRTHSQHMFKLFVPKHAEINARRMDRARTRVKDWGHSILDTQLTTRA